MLLNGNKQTNNATDHSSSRSVIDQRSRDSRNLGQGQS